MLVVEHTPAGGDATMLAFQTTSFVPIERRLIEPALLTPDERAWLDAYHAETLRRATPLLDADTRAWLEEKCAPIG